MTSKSRTWTWTWRSTLRSKFSREVSFYPSRKSTKQQASWYEFPGQLNFLIPYVFPLQILDSRDLTITSVHDLSTKDALNFIKGENTATFGQKIEITLPDQDRLKVSIEYATSSKATALQWLNPQQTSGKKHPFLFSQCQAIHCRSMVPCQDTPGNKVTYSAKVICTYLIRFFFKMLISLS